MRSALMFLTPYFTGGLMEAVAWWMKPVDLDQIRYKNTYLDKGTSQ